MRFTAAVMQMITRRLASVDAERKGCCMKIEKVSENQIRCTLTREDLASRELKISELAYGTEKAKNLFRDMMQQANFEFGFEAEDIPLMIEAIPLNSECIVLIITKVEDPEELDTRFSRFAPSVTEDDEYDEEEEETAGRASDDILDLFRRIQENSKQESAPAPAELPVEESQKRTHVFRMDTMQQVMNAAVMTGGHYRGASSLYKDEGAGCYYILVTQEQEESAVFDRICFCLSEFGARHRISNRTYIEEHCELLVEGNALQALSGNK